MMQFIPSVGRIGRPGGGGGGGVTTPTSPQTLHMRPPGVKN